MKRPRLRVRTFMIVVAVLAILLGVERAWQRYRTCRRAMEYHANSMDVFSGRAAIRKRVVETTRSVLTQLRKQREALISPAKTLTQSRFFNFMLTASLKAATKRDEDTLGRLQRDLANYEYEYTSDFQMIEYHKTLRDRYRRASVRPWLRLPEIPPPPDLEERGVYHLERRDLGRAIVDYAEAIGSFEDPDEDEIKLGFTTPKARIYNALAWIRATCPDAKYRDGKQAIREATRACELTGWRLHAYVGTLAVAYAESGDFPSAIEWQLKAIRLLSGNEAELGEYSDRLALFQASTPYRSHPIASAATNP